MLAETILAVTIGIFSTVCSAQLYSSCNPVTTNVTCTPNPALGSTKIEVDFTSGAADEHFSNVEGTAVTYDSTKGAVFNISTSDDSPTLVSNKYIFFGRVDVVYTAAPGVGVVTAITLQSDDLDEIDWEWIGGETQRAQSNFFSKGSVVTYDRAETHSVTNAMTESHTYSFDWTAERLQWLIDGTVVRTLNYDDVDSDGYPQTPSQVRLGTWVAGKSSSSQGLIDWSGGLTDFSEGPFVAYIKSVSVTDYSNGVANATEYVWTDSSGSYESVEVVTDSATDSSSSSSSTLSTSTSSTASTSTSIFTTSITSAPTSSTSSSGASTSNSTGVGTTHLEDIASETLDTATSSTYDNSSLPTAAPTETAPEEDADCNGEEQDQSTGHIGYSSNDKESLAPPTLAAVSTTPTASTGMQSNTLVTPIASTAPCNETTFTSILILPTQKSATAAAAGTTTPPAIRGSTTSLVSSSTTPTTLSTATASTSKQSSTAENAEGNLGAANVNGTASSSHSEDVADKSAGSFIGEGIGSSNSTFAGSGIAATGSTGDSSATSVAEAGGSNNVFMASGATRVVSGRMVMVIGTLAVALVM